MSGTRWPCKGRRTVCGTGIWRPTQVYFSPQWKAILGFGDNEFPNEFEAWHKRIHPDDRPLADSTISLYLNGRLTDYEMEHRLRHKDGTYRWILARGAALRHTDGTPYRFAGSHIRHHRPARTSRSNCVNKTNGSKSPPSPNAKPWKR